MDSSIIESKEDEWTKQDIQDLPGLLTDRSLEAVAKKLGKTTASIELKVKELDLIRINIQTITMKRSILIVSPNTLFSTIKKQLGEPTGILRWGGPVFDGTGGPRELEDDLTVKQLINTSYLKLYMKDIIFGKRGFTLNWLPNIIKNF